MLGQHESQRKSDKGLLDLDVNFAVLDIYLYVQGFQGSLEVSNNPMVSRSEEELKELARVRTLRSIELADREVRVNWPA